MLTIFKARIEKTKQFVVQHPTLTACAATAVITRKMTRAAVLEDVLEEVSDLAYEWGMQTGILEINNGILLDFVVENDLQEDLWKFIVRLKGIH